MSLSLIFTEQELTQLRDPNNDNKTVYVRYGRDETEYYYITSIDSHGHIYGFNSTEQSFGHIHEIELWSRLSMKQPIKPFPLSRITNEIRFNNTLKGFYDMYQDYKQGKESKEIKETEQLIPTEPSEKTEPTTLDIVESTEEFDTPIPQKEVEQQDKEKDFETLREHHASQETEFLSR
ncbi:MAG: hypothetical protein K1X55_13170 [Chitinophagales bacterium]|nr:hypothetical protein [Chitinophagales bacterium]